MFVKLQPFTEFFSSYLGFGCFFLDFRLIICELNVVFLGILFFPKIPSARLFCNSSFI